MYDFKRTLKRIAKCQRLGYPYLNVCVNQQFRFMPRLSFALQPVVETRDLLIDVGNIDVFYTKHVLVHVEKTSIFSKSIMGFPFGVFPWSFLVLCVSLWFLCGSFVCPFGSVLGPLCVSFWVLLDLFGWLVVGPASTLGIICFFVFPSQRLW